jgi:hypothetical protein
MICCSTQCAASSVDQGPSPGTAELACPRARPRALCAAGVVKLAAEGQLPQRTLYLVVPTLDLCSQLSVRQLAGSCWLVGVLVAPLPGR